MKKEISKGRLIVAAISTILVWAICMIPLRVGADGMLGIQKEHKSLVASGATDKEQVENYNLYIIEDEEVPLSSGRSDYSERTVPIITVCVIFVMFIMYVMWYRGHVRRIEGLYSMLGVSDLKELSQLNPLHPIKTIQFEKELESRVV